MTEYLQLVFILVACALLWMLVLDHLSAKKARKRSEDLYRASNDKILDNDRERTDAYKATLARLEVVEQQKREELNRIRRLEQAKLKELEKINFWRTR